MQVPDAVSRSAGYCVPSSPHPLHVPNPPPSPGGRTTKRGYCGRHVMSLSSEYNVGFGFFLDELRWVAHIARAQLLVLESYDGTANVNKSK